MNHGRRQSILNNMTAVARKVYEAVPIQDRWSILQMSNEMQRLGTRVQWPILSGILNDLAQQRLIHTNPQDLFWRDADEVPKARAEAITEFRSAVTPPDRNPVPEFEAMPFDVLTELSNVSAKLRADAAALQERAQVIDDIALKAADAIQQAGAGNEELKAMKELMKRFVS